MRIKKQHKEKIDKIIAKAQQIQEPKSDQPDDSNVPRITNETIAEHREHVISRARKYIYPLQHSKHKIVLISVALFVTAVVIFFSYTTVALYRFKSNTGFLFGVTKVIPFPIAKVGPNFVAYENYLYELRHYIHYYETQQKIDFNNDDKAKQQLAAYKSRALQKVVDDAYIKQLAKQNKVSISDRELNDAIELVRSQNRLGANEKGFEDVLKDNFGWTLGDFKRSLKQELLTQKLIATLDTDTKARANEAYAKIKSGSKFEAIAKKYSDDKTSAKNGGEYGFLIDKTNRDLPAQVTQTLFELKPGQTSSIINTGYTLEIVKLLEKQGKRVKAAHIVFSLKDISIYLNALKEKQQARMFIKL